MKMLRGVTELEPGSLGERFDTALALGKDRQQEQAMGLCECSRHGGKLLEYKVLGAWTCIARGSSYHVA